MASGSSPGPVDADPTVETSSKEEGLTATRDSNPAAVPVTVNGGQTLIKLVNEPPVPPAVPPPPPDEAKAPVRTNKIVTLEYPAIAKTPGFELEGWVILQAVIDTDGKVRNVTVKESSHRVFEEPARKAVLQYEVRTRPAERSS